jgi:hypothetical protein
MLCGGGGWPHQQTDVLKINLIAARHVHVDSLWAIYKVQWEQTRKPHPYKHQLPKQSSATSLRRTMMANVADELRRMGRSQISGHVVYLHLQLRLNTIANICTLLTFSGVIW